MERISIRRSWATGVAAVRERWRDVAIIVLAATLLPGLLDYFLSGNLLATPDSSGMFLGTASSAIIGGWLGTAGYLAAWRRLADGGATWSAVILYGLVAAVTIFLVGLLIGVAMFAVFGTGLTGIFAGLGADSDTVAGRAIGFMLLILAVIVGMLWLVARLLLTGPSMASVPTYNPFHGLATSWRLTKATQWKLTGFLLVLGLISMVAAGMAGGAVLATGVAAGDLLHPTLGMVIGTALVQAAITMLWIAVAEGLYREASGVRDVAEVFA